MDALKRYFRSPAAVIGLVLLLIVVGDGGERRLASFRAIRWRWPGVRCSGRSRIRASGSAPTIPAATSPRRSSMARASRC